MAMEAPIPCPNCGKEAFETCKGIHCPHCGYPNFQIPNEDDVADFSDTFEIGEGLSQIISK